MVVLSIIFAVITIGCVVAALLVILWPEDRSSTSTETLQLSENVKISVDVPRGWKAIESDDSEAPGRYLLVPRSEQRTYSQLDNQSAELPKSTGIAPISAVELFAIACTDLDAASLRDKEQVGDWTVGTEQISRSSVSASRTIAFRQLDNGICLVAHGISVAHSADDLSGEPAELVRKVSRGDVVTKVTQGGI